MKIWWQKIRKMKLLIIFLMVFLFLSAVGYSLSRLGIVQVAIMDYQTLLFLVCFGIMAVLFGILWILGAPDVHRTLLLFALSVTTVGLYTAMLQSAQFYGFIGMFLLVIAGVPAFRKYKLVFFIAYPLFYIVGCIFFGYFEFGCFLIHAFGFGVAVSSLYFQNKPWNYALAGASLVVPVLVSLLFAGLYLSDMVSAPPSIRGELSAPFEEHLLYQQKITQDFIDTTYSLTIYRPLSLGFYKEIGTYASEGYLPELTLSDFQWEAVDEDTYRLNFYYFEGEMQRSLLINL